ncbi:16S rRNA (cytosine(1402)-N(4))-methyltransferase [Sandarakinorhabdus cyanobacteriorum]|uniref:Ribosomal RNA small subunit methyltransferase H n=1 Tax=Sandarakinorhabdus cyanobacteriorum TaxID=1981098 RepID=A0A255Y8X7_9SPHN|nr:16S rRNA (cytosine(1402)-N(4))-methyltransferase RsmH [Sandarakinorhabdus cyanobacteriorum]OYQ25696.1 16S rRNA (cytosine(1402)-N(4))-methyltransferase [Sandarakinorhabdus cyanobacteriorum]
MSAAPHVPVLLDEVMAALNLAAGDIYVDATLGAGGYLRAARAAGLAHAYGFDRDPDAHALNADLAGLDDVTLIRRPFAELGAGLADHGVAAVDAIAFDIGVSSMQIDRAERGFSFQADGPLDMRMAQEGMSAADFINSASETEIADVLYHLGDERASRRIARAIVADRPFSRTSELAGLIRRVLGRGEPGKDPATRSFQALRIHVNDELGQLDAGLAAAERLLKPGGRLAVVSFHSAEDRRVKAFLRDRSGSAPAASRHQPYAARGPAPSFEKPAKAVRPSDAEIARNPRARSATLRSAVRTAAPAWPTTVEGRA